MALPLPSVIPNTEAGGGLVTAMRGMNALQQSMLENQINQIKAQYAPYTVPAEAASKLAYANLMGPQFLAKLIGNEDILANTPDVQKKNILNYLFNTGGNASGANPFGFNAQNNQGLLPFLVDKMKNVFSQTPQPQSDNQLPQNFISNQPQNIPRNPLGTSGYQPSQQEQQAANNLQPGESVQVGVNPSAPPMNTGEPREGQSFAQTSGEFKGAKAQGEEMGKSRAKDVQQFNDDIYTYEDNKAAFENVADMLKSPIAETIRQVPLAGHHEIDWYEKNGSRDQREYIGNLKSAFGDLIVEGSKRFSGAFRTGEQALLNQMKPSPSDTIDTMRGKVENALYLNDFKLERAKLASKYMQPPYNYNKNDAIAEADKQLKGNDIRQQIEDQVYPTLTVRNKKTGQIQKLTRSKARELGVNIGG